ncbi:CBS domain-containing protein [Candidatus Nomurabacteria bacterium]|nr:CBS domain-containing protein [Candidatus Nomurabacteria bacterium]
MIILLLIFVILLVMLTSVTFDIGQDSQFERRRKEEKGEVSVYIRRANNIVELISLQRIGISILLVLAVIFAILASGWVTGGIISVAVALFYGTLAKLSFVQRFSQGLYEKYEKFILDFIERYPKLTSVLRSVNTYSSGTKLGSREEFVHVVDGADGILEKDEQQLIRHALSFREKTVESIMTPRSVIESIKKGEILGPVVLDDLHNRGHSRYPVVDDDVDNIIGILHVKNILQLDTKRRHTAKVETAMDSKVYYINEKQTLDNALAAFLRTHYHMFVVVNEYQETVGLLTLEDTVEALLGRKIIDEFDRHDDLREVARRKAGKEQRARKSQTI